MVSEADYWHGDRRKFLIDSQIKTIALFVFLYFLLSFIVQFQELVTLVPIDLEQLSSWNEWLHNLLPNELIEDVRGLGTLTQNLQAWTNNLVGNFFDLFTSTLVVHQINYDRLIEDIIVST